MTVPIEPPARASDPSGWQRALAACHVDPALVAAGIESGEIGVAVLLDTAAGRSTWDASCEPAYTAVEVEVLLDGGPAGLTIESARVVRVADVAADARWPSWRQVATRLGWRDVLAAPVALDEGEGAVVLYARTPGALDALMLLEEISASVAGSEVADAAEIADRADGAGQGD